MSAPAVFLDRDGTLIHDPNFVRDPEQVHLLPGAARAVKRLREAGFRIIVVTNQSGVARGLIDEKALAAIHERMRERFAAEGAAFDAIYYCPYLDTDEVVVERYRQDSPLRKPRAGMYLEAAREHDIDLSRSWSIGDKDRDSQAGKAAGCRTIQLVSDPTQAKPGAADFVARDLEQAAAIILSPSANGPPDNAQRHAIDEIARDLRRIERSLSHEDFELTRLIGTVAQFLAVGVAVFAIVGSIGAGSIAYRWFAAIFLQLLAITCFLTGRRR
jgi:D-glycero-D-manno-heptose 1,7-bisphosphate phosphatase